MSSNIQYYQTRRISDMTEGRGHMINDLAFTKWQDAADYINSQPGVMGRRRTWTDETWGCDWDILTIDVMDGPFDIEADARAKALSKLTPDERKLLGLE